MKHSHELTLDGNGVPILTEVVSSTHRADQNTQVERLSGMSIDEISAELLANPDLVQQLETLSSEIAAQTCQHVATDIERAIQDAVNKAVTTEINNTQNAISAKIAKVLPEILSRILSQGSR